jgi:Exopolyphosphatase-related proteins
MNNIFEKIGEAKTIGISGHVRPDGDCTGSCLALYTYLSNQYADKKIDLYMEYVSENFNFLVNSDQIKNRYEDEIQYDLFISLDCGSSDRLGEAEKYFLGAKSTINIDHHISNTGFAQINHVKEASSTCEILFELFEEDAIDIKIAEALYTGIIHDTGVFKHSNTTERTMTIAGKLISKGVDFSRLIDESFYQKTYVQNQILGRCLLESIFVLDGKCIVSSINQKMLEFYGATSKDLDGIIDQMRITKGVEVAILIHETNFHEHKVSMRSNSFVDVSKVAVYFGGGGHIRAAGCTMIGSVHDVVNNLTAHIEPQLHSN